MNILITGVDGFIGAALKEWLTRAGHRVTGTVFYSLQDKNLPGPGPGEIYFDILSQDDFLKLPAGPWDAVIHTIGIVDQTAPADLMLEVNALGTGRMATWAREQGCSHFIHLSSVSVYGLRTLGMNRTEESTPRCRHPFVIPYMRSKTLAERMVEKSGLYYTILRLPAVLGRQDTYLSPTIISYLEDGRFFLCGAGTRPVSLLYIKNLGPVIELLLDYGPLNDAFNCCDFHVDFFALAHMYARALGVPFAPGKRPLFSLPFYLHDKHYQLILIFSRFGSHFPDTKLHRVLPHEHPYSWEDGVKSAVAGYRAGKRRKSGRCEGG